MSEKKIGVVQCPSLKMYGDFLGRRGFSIHTFLNEAPQGVELIIFCKDHLTEPTVLEAGRSFAGPKLLINADVPEGWTQARRLSMPLLPLDLENTILQLLEATPQAATSHRILIVEDDVTIAMTVVRTFQEGGFEVRVCRGFAELASALQHKPELIVMDLNLPGLSGEKLGEMLRKQKIPVVIFSSEREERLEEARKKIGAVAVFPKDTPQREMRDWIRNYLEKDREAAGR